MMAKELGSLSDELLVKMAQEGSAQAEEYLISKYKNLAKAKSQIYFIVGGDRDDVTQEGMIGIFKAIRDFDVQKEATFKTFADLCVNRQIITAIKAANRKKHQALNESISINSTLDDGDEETNALELQASDGDTNPESFMMMKEVVRVLTADGSKVFSPFESQVWTGVIQGKNYREIALEMGKNPKTVDNALQRIKRKISAYLAG